MRDSSYDLNRIIHVNFNILYAQGLVSHILVRCELCWNKKLIDRFVRKVHLHIFILIPKRILRTLRASEYSLFCLSHDPNQSINKQTKRKPFRKNVSRYFLVFFWFKKEFRRNLFSLWKSQPWQVFVDKLCSICCMCWNILRIYPTINQFLHPTYAWTKLTKADSPVIACNLYSQRNFLYLITKCGSTLVFIPPGCLHIWRQQCCMVFTRATKTYLNIWR